MVRIQTTLARGPDWVKAAAGLEAGDVGVVVHVHRNGEAFEVEFMTLDGNTLTVETLTAEQIRAARNRDIPHVRERTVAA